MGDNKLLVELLKAQDNLQVVDFEINNKKFSYYFRYMTLLEKTRVEQMCVKTVTTFNDDGSKVVKHEKQENMTPIHTILEKALNKKGDRLYSHTNSEHFKEVSLLPIQVASEVAYMMTIDIFGNLNPEEEEQK
jgi:hypothetical protein